MRITKLDGDSLKKISLNIKREKKLFNFGYRIFWKKMNDKSRSISFRFKFNLNLTINLTIGKDLKLFFKS